MYLKIILTLILIVLIIRCTIDLLPGEAQAQASGVQDINILKVGGSYVFDYLPVKVK